MHDMDDPEEDPAVLTATLRAMFDSLVRLPTDDPLKRQSRVFLARILDLLENGDETPRGRAPS